MNRMLWAVLLSASATSFADETVQYDFVSQGKVEGGQTVVYHDDGIIEVDFHFNDRGRGPKIHEVMQLDKQGLLTATHIRGHGYLGAKIDERYHNDATGAHWRNGVDDGSRDARGSAWYVTMNGTPESFVAMARAALNNKDHKLALLPSGELHIKKLKTIKVPVGEGEQNANLYAITGLGLTPQDLWLTDDLRYIGYASSWNSLVLKGWEAALPTLKAESEAMEQRFYADLSKQAMRKVQPVMLIDNARVLDVVTATLSEPTKIWIEQGKFIASPSKPPKTFEYLDAKGAVLMPGLWDMHSHLFDSSAVLNIAGGVTSVRDLGNSKTELDTLITRIQRAEIAGPQVYRAALLDADSPFRAPTGDIAKTEQEALQLIDKRAKEGFLQIKLYSSIPPAWVPALVARAHQHGLRVSGHIPAFMTAEQAVRAGYDEIQHANMLFLNFLTSSTDDTRTPLRFTLVGDKAGEVDLDSKPVQDFLALLKTKQTVVDPTLGIFVAMFSHERGKPNPTFAGIFDHLPITIQRSQLQPEMDINDDNRASYQRAAVALKQLVKRLYDHGIPIVAGTDDIAGFALHRELELYVEAGIPTADVLRIATVNAAKLVGAGAQKGQIKPGFDADWILLDANPLDNISALRRVRTVMINDVLYDPSRIHQGLSIKPFVSVNTATAMH